MGRGQSRSTSKSRTSTQITDILCPAKSRLRAETDGQRRHGRRAPARIPLRTPNGRVLQHTYDHRDRRRVSSDDDGHVETRTYTPDGLVASITDADGRSTAQFHDGLHRLVRA